MSRDVPDKSIVKSMPSSMLQSEDFSESEGMMQGTANTGSSVSVAVATVRTKCLQSKRMVVCDAEGLFAHQRVNGMCGS